MQCTRMYHVIRLAVAYVQYGAVYNRLDDTDVVSNLCGNNVTTGRLTLHP